MGEELTMAHQHVAGAACLHCGLDYQFDLPQEIVDAAHSRDLVVFAGAGISTEVPSVFPETVYEMVREKIEVGDGSDDFPDVMQKFQEKYSRQELVRLIKRKFDYINSFPQPRSEARKFHRELATMPYLRDVITTNWDTYFEEESMAIPFVTGEDVAFYDMPSRRVFKIHGSMTNLASLIITQADYDRRLEELKTNVMGGFLRQFLATKTVVFVGYSLRDWNFQRLYEALRDDMKEYAPKAYLVSPFPNPEAEKFKLTVLETSGTQFLRQLKSSLLGHCFLSDDIYSEAMRVLVTDVAVALRIAAKVNFKDYPAILYCWAYQDGLRDALSRAIQCRGSGEYSDRQHVVESVRSYIELEDRASEDGRYDDAAYIAGYIGGLLILLSDDEIGVTDKLTLYFFYGADEPVRTQGPGIVVF
jgi:NAD-dependent SIR2 family protein deacetylase